MRLALSPLILGSTCSIIGGWSLTLFNLGFYGLAVVSCLQISIRPSDATTIIALAWTSLIFGCVLLPIYFFARIIRFYRLRHGITHISYRIHSPHIASYDRD